MLAVLSGFPSQVKWINWDALATQARTGIKRHETKRFGLGGVDNFPNVDAHRAIDHFQFIDQGNVYAPKGVLQELGRFGHPARGNRDDCLDGFGIQLDRLLQAGGRISSADLVEEGNFVDWVVSILPPGRKSQGDIS